MTPREKAEYLISAVYPYADGHIEGESFHDIQRESAARIAEIFCDEMIKWHVIHWGNASDTVQYWQEVKEVLQIF